jgi:hypothetical protein
LSKSIRSLLLALAVLTLSGWAVWSALQYFQVALYQLAASRLEH